MRSIKLNNPQYRLLEKGFENWLRTLNFADSTVYNSPAYLKAFFHFLEQNQVTDLHQVDKSHIRDYITYLSQRKNQRRGGGLSINYLTSNINALKRFGRYLRETRKQNLEVDIKLPPEKETAKAEKVFSVKEEMKKVAAKKASPEKIKQTQIIIFSCSM